MSRLFAAICVSAGLSLALGPTRAQEPVPVPADEPGLSLGALLSLEAPEESPLFEQSNGVAATRSLMALVTPADFVPASQFDVIDFDQNAANTGAFQIPPDPAGAAGPNHVVAVVRSSIRWFTKDGALQHNQSLRAFFANLPVSQSSTFNPRVVYDPHHARFLVMAVERAAPPNRSRIYVAASDDADPNGSWRVLSIDSRLIVGGVEWWADFPGFAVDEEAIYITANMFTFTSNAFAGVRLWIVPKASFYSGGSVTIRLFNPITAGAAATTTQPAMMHAGAPASVGTFLMQYGGLSDGVNAFLGMIRIDNPLTATRFVNIFLPFGPVAQVDTLAAFPAAAQLGTARTIATSDRRISHAPVWRDHNLYLAAPVLPPASAGADAGQVTARWFRIDTSSIDAPVVAETGTVGGEDIAPGTHTFFPAAGVARNGSIALAFAASGPVIYPGAYYALHLAGDASGTTRPAAPVRAGVDYYVRAFSSNMTVASPWGNYTSVSVDPADEGALWVLGEYAQPRGTVIFNPPGLTHEDGRWGTAFGRVDTEPPVISNASATPGVLWPPNHEMVDVAIDYTATDNAGAACSLSASSSDAPDAEGDGATAPDWNVIDDRRVQLRAERAATGPGRVYTITITCTDGTWTATDAVTVAVPHSRR